MAMPNNHCDSAMNRPADKKLQFRRIKDGVDLSCQHVGLYEDDLPAIFMKVNEQASKFAEDDFHLDLTLNALYEHHLSGILTWLDACPNLHIKLADNFFSWEDLKNVFKKAGTTR
eukprot:gene3653-13729_t